MIILDTHIWFFYINEGDEKLSAAAKRACRQTDVLGVSVISCWEIAMLVAKERLKLRIDVQDWIAGALRYKGIKLVEMTPEIAVLATRLPGTFHKDPADRIIVASCLNHAASLITLDRNIRDWGHIQTVS